MTDPVSTPEQEARDHATPPSMPRWVKVSALVVVVVVLVLVLIIALAGGEHGPGLHAGVGVSSGGVLAPVGLPEVGAS